MRTDFSPQRDRAGRIGVTVFFVVLALLCFSGTYLLVPVIRATYDGGGDVIPRWRCVEVLAGDLIRVAEDDTTHLVRIAGIRCPPPERGPELAEVMAELNMREADLLKKGQIAQKTLYAWINRRRARLDVVSEDGELLTAFVYVGGVDLGRKMLQNGQAYVTSLEHQRRDRYLELQQKAQDRSIGLWRR